MYSEDHPARFVKPWRAMAQSPSKAYLLSILDKPRGGLHSLTELLQQ